MFPELRPRFLRVDQKARDRALFRAVPSVNGRSLARSQIKLRNLSPLVNLDIDCVFIMIRAAPITSFNKQKFVSHLVVPFGLFPPAYEYLTSGQLENRRERFR
jgi:hypothetical protein